MMITDEQMLKSLKTVRQYCKEHDNCDECVFRRICKHCEDDDYDYPMEWELLGDDNNEN